MTSKIRCLAIEDTLHDQNMIKRAIAGAGINADIEFASTLTAAKQALATGRFPIILCDNNLPDGSGVDFAQELTNQPAHRDTKIVIISGWPSPFMWAKANAAGLQVIDKNNQPQIKLIEIFRRRLMAHQPKRAS